MTTRRVARSNNRSHTAGATYDDMTIAPASSTGGDSLRSSLELSRSLAHAGSTRLIVLARSDVPYRVGREGRDEHGGRRQGSFCAIKNFCGHVVLCAQGAGRRCRRVVQMTARCGVPLAHLGWTAEHARADVSRAGWHSQVRCTGDCHLGAQAVDGECG